ncbi:hypothetical protein TREES_T100003345 [Tupaia chinensis]|uniref:Uncharacterized protein n=1 Tax=Tupaia chinensis TaxID=246437 RepID=L9JB20_TUPCH|nr:hypothetical protein TREES_T100003345 [Tupaia chinensis]
MPDRPMEEQGIIHYPFLELPGAPCAENKRSQAFSDYPPFHQNSLTRKGFRSFTLLMLTGPPSTVVLADTEQAQEAYCVALSSNPLHWVEANLKPSDEPEKKEGNKNEDSGCMTECFTKMYISIERMSLTSLVWKEFMEKKIN